MSQETVSTDASLSSRDYAQFNNFLVSNGINIFKVHPAYGNESVCYCPLRDKGNYTQQVELAKLLVKALGNIGVSSHVGVYPVNTNETAVIITDGVETLLEHSSVTVLSPESFVARLRAESVNSDNVAMAAIAGK